MNIVLSGILQKYTGYQREHCIAAATVREAIESLVKTFPGLNPILFDPAGQMRRAHTVFLNGDQIFADQLMRPATEQDKLEILTAIAGG